MYSEPGTADRKIVFLHMTEKQKAETLWDMLNYANGQRAILEAKVADLRRDTDFIQRELDGIAHRKTDTVELDTTDKMNAVLDKRSAGWFWYRDKILPPTLAWIQTLIVGALLYFVFGGKLP